jgi:hypothetical protein
MRSPGFLVLGALFFSLLDSAVLAEEKADVSELYGQNYRFSLVYTSPEKQQSSLEFVASAKGFEVSIFEPRLEFSGNILSTGRESLVLQYDLRLQKQVVTSSFKQAENDTPFQSVQTIHGGLSSTVRLEYGTAVDILQIGPESARLVVTKVD